MLNQFIIEEIGETCYFLWPWCYTHVAPTINDSMIVTHLHKILAIVSLKDLVNEYGVMLSFMFQWHTIQLKESFSEISFALMGKKIKGWRLTLSSHLLVSQFDFFDNKTEYSYLMIT